MLCFAYVELISLRTPGLLWKIFEILFLLRLCENSLTPIASSLTWHLNRGGFSTAFIVIFSGTHFRTFPSPPSFMICLTRRTQPNFPPLKHWSFPPGSRSSVTVSFPPFCILLLLSRFENICIFLREFRPFVPRALFPVSVEHPPFPPLCCLTVFFERKVKGFLLPV